jgi:hypothetical protein
MRIRHILPVVALLVLVSGTATATAQPGFTPRSEKDPYRNLFGERLRAEKPTPSPKLATPSPPPPQSPQAPTIVCGMRIVPADPSVDPKIRVIPPAGVEHSMRIVIPPMCKPK